MVLSTTNLDFHNFHKKIFHIRFRMITGKFYFYCLSISKSFKKENDVLSKMFCPWTLNSGHLGGKHLQFIILYLFARLLKKFQGKNLFYVYLWPCNTQFLWQKMINNDIFKFKKAYLKQIYIMITKSQK